jgi:alanine racemase
MPHLHKTYLEIDLGALAHNVNFIRNQMSPDTKVLSVVKAFAYGHDAVVIAKKLESLSIDYFAVAYVREGITLRKAGITKPILVLHPQWDDVQNCVKHNLEPNVYSLRVLQHFLKVFQTLNTLQFPIHLKFNTGLNRLGFKMSDIQDIAKILKHQNHVTVQSVFSHLVASEDMNSKELTLDQIRQYHEIVAKLEVALDHTFIKHLTNTSGTLNYPEAHFDMVRIGIGLYGYGNDSHWTSQLKSVGKLYSTITQIHEVKPGESVGYNQGYIAQKITRSATIPLGHADGIPRSWGKGKGFVMINGKSAPILGNVCMDMIMVDVTDILCNEGDRVVVYDNQETVENIANNVGTISYELITAISQRVHRVIKE